MVALKLLAWSSLLLTVSARSASSTRPAPWENLHSFGHSLPISKDGSKIPNFEVMGSPHILSDRIVLTPPVPGDQRTALWNFKQNFFSDWELELPFRVSGPPEKAGGMFHIWYTSHGPQGIGTKSVYNVKPFDGMAIVVDSFGGRRGSMRAFLNDGSTDYSLHHQPQSLAFGHCDFNYRNLGVLTTIKVIYSSTKGLRVEYNDKVCFETDQVKLPGGYHFGISAASTKDGPDSFEVFGFKVRGYGKVADQSGGTSGGASGDKKDMDKDKSQKQNAKKDDKEFKPMKGKPKEATRDSYSSSTSSSTGGGGAGIFEPQFRDINSRLTAMANQLDALQKILNDKILPKLDSVNLDVTKNVKEHSGRDAIERMEKRIGTIDRQLGQMEKNVKDIKDSNVHEKIEDLHNTVKDHHSNLVYSLPGTMHAVIKDSGPRIGMGITILLVFQAMLAIAYVLYKRRRAVAPKKFL